MLLKMEMIQNELKMVGILPTDSVGDFSKIRFSFSGEEDTSIYCFHGHDMQSKIFYGYMRWIPSST